MKDEDEENPASIIIQLTEGADTPVVRSLES